MNKEKSETIRGIFLALILVRIIQKKGSGTLKLIFQVLPLYAFLKVADQTLLH